jgi:hypothetical protein
MNYDALVSSLQLQMEEDSAEFLSELPQIVSRAQNYLQRRLDPPATFTYTTVSCSASNPLLSLPSDLLVLKNLELVRDERRPLLQQNNEWLSVYWPVATSVGTPKYYAARDNSTVMLAPTPVSNAPVLVEYVAREPILSTSTSTNWFSQQADNAFVLAAMMYSNLWAKNAELAQVWKQQTDEELTALNNEFRRARRQDASDRTSGTPENNIAEGAR